MRGQGCESKICVLSFVLRVPVVAAVPCSGYVLDLHVSDSRLRLDSARALGSSRARSLSNQKTGLGPGPVSTNQRAAGERNAGCKGDSALWTGDTLRVVPLD